MSEESLLIHSRFPQHSNNGKFFDTNGILHVWGYFLVIYFKKKEKKIFFICFLFTILSIFAANSYPLPMK